MSTKDKVLVLKVGGALMQCEMGMARLMDTAAKMLAQGQKVVLVHGGGYLVDEQLKANGMDTVKLDGLRVTPPEQMPIIAGALAGMSNKILQAAAIKAGVTSVGMSLADANLVDAVIKDERLGLVGEVSPKTAAISISSCLRVGCPLSAPLQYPAKGNCLTSMPIRLPQC